MDDIKHDQLSKRFNYRKYNNTFPVILHRDGNVGNVVINRFNHWNDCY